MNWLDKIRNPNCEECPLYESTEDEVCIMGAGPRKAQILVVLEAPVDGTDSGDSPLATNAGKLLSRGLANVGIDPASCYVTYAAKCSDPDGTPPTRGQVKACRGYLSDEVEKVQPEFILALGNSGLLATAKKSGITKHRGNLYDTDLGPQVFCTIHPSSVIRNPKNASTFTADLERFARLIKGELSEIKTRTSIIRNKSQLRALIHYLQEASIIAYDLETTGLEEWRTDAAIVSLSVTCEEGRSFVVPLWHKSTPWKNPQNVLDKLKPCFERKDCRYVAHNGKFDCRWLARFGIIVPQTFDTMLAAHILDENRPKSLKFLSQLLLGADAYDIGEDVKDAYNVPLKRLAIYNGKDTDYTFRLYKIFRKQLIAQPRLKRLFTHLIMPVSNILTKTEAIGMWVDPEQLAKATGMCEKGMGICEAGMSEFQTHPVNINSPKQVAEWLFSELGLPLIESTAKGAPSTKESVLLQLAKQHPVPRSILSWRKWSKYKSTYLLPWSTDRDVRGRIHPNYLIHGTVTGRLSCKGPNLQQVPRDTVIRSCMAAPKGKVFVEADYSQIELRIAAMLSEDPEMLESFFTGEDLHMKTAEFMTGKKAKNIEPEERKKAKAVNFGFLYGMGAAKFVDYARDSYDAEFTLEEAEEVRDNFFRTYRRLKPWHDRQRRVATNHHYVVSRVGRVRHLPDIQSRDKMVRAEAERQAINSPVQGLASDLMLMSMIDIDKAFGREVTIIGTVHDALLMEIDAKHVKTAIPKIKRIMENPRIEEVFDAELTVPIEVEIKIGKFWGDALKVV